jgi:hypothetical protein
VERLREPVEQLAAAVQHLDHAGGDRVKVGAENLGLRIQGDESSAQVAKAAPAKTCFMRKLICRP